MKDKFIRPMNILLNLIQKWVVSLIGGAKTQGNAHGNRLQI